MNTKKMNQFNLKIYENDLNNFKSICKKYEVKYTDMVKLLLNFCICKEKETSNIVLYLKNEIKEEL